MARRGFTIIEYSIIGFALIVALLELYWAMG